MSPHGIRMAYAFNGMNAAKNAVVKMIEEQAGTEADAAFRKAFGDMLDAPYILLTPATDTKGLDFETFPSTVERFFHAVIRSGHPERWSDLLTAAEKTKRVPAENLLKLTKLGMAAERSGFTDKPEPQLTVVSNAA
jgi:hypothetical protein